MPLKLSILTRHMIKVAVLNCRSQNNGSPISEGDKQKQLLISQWPLLILLAEMETVGFLFLCAFSVCT